VGHCYYFADFVFPVVAELRGWRLKRLVVSPWPLRWLNPLV
jgi:Derlin-2/3